MTATTIASLWTCPERVAGFRPPSKIRGFTLPADPTDEQVNAAWDVLEQLDGDAGSWLRYSHSPDVLSPDDHVKTALEIAKVAYELREAIRVADAAQKAPAP